MESINPYIHIVAAIIISAALVSSGQIIAESIQESKKIETEQLAAYIKTNNELFDSKELAEYLKITTEELTTMIEKDDQEKKALQLNDVPWNTYRYIPYVTISDEKRFIKTEIEKWLNYHSGMG